MATIQIRNIPESVHRIYRSRAAAAGLSLQEYLRLDLVRQASLMTPAEVVAEVEEDLRRDGTEGFSRGSSVDLIRADRASH